VTSSANATCRVTAKTSSSFTFDCSNTSPVYWIAVPYKNE
jgi:hypothetical protein